MIKCYFKFLFKGNFYRITFLLLSTFVVNAQTYPDDIQLSSINYSSYVPPSGQAPEYLVPFTEGLFNNTITRISDSQVFGTTGTNLRHNYSSDQPWNSDGSLIKLAGSPSAILDGNSYELLYWRNIPTYGRWSNKTPNLMYGVSGNQFVSYDVVNDNRTTLNVFNDFESVDVGFGEGNLSNDDRFVALIGLNGNDRTLIVYDILNNQITGTKYLGSEGDLDWFSVSPSGKFAIVSYRDDGSGIYQGYKRYDIDLTNEMHLYDSTAHGDMGFDANGNDVLVQFGDSTTWDQDYYLTMIHLDNAQVTPLFYWPQEDHNGLTGIWGGHVSLRNTIRPGWAYVSEGCCTDHPVAAREIFAIKLDGSNTVERFAVHHSDYTAGYGHEAQAVPNRDGSKVMFGSNWNNAFGGQYAPSYIVEKKTSNTGTVTANAGADVSICEGSSTTLTASGGDQYLWNTGETTASIQVSPTATSTYTVTVSSGPESDTDSVVVTVNTIPEANAGNDVTIEQGQDVTLTATGGTNYLWSNGSTSQSITMSPDVTTTYSVEVSQNGCTSEDSVTVTVVQANTGTVTANAGEDISICEGSSATLTATGGDQYLWNTGEATASIQVSPTATSTYTVTVSSGSESDTDSVVVTVNTIPEANAGNDVTIEQGQNATLTATGGTSYQWSNGSTSQSITVSPEITTTYWVEVIENNCSSFDEVTVEVAEPILAYAGKDVTICSGESVELTASGGSKYVWNTGETSQSIVVAPTHTSVYEVTVTDGISQGKDKVKVTVIQCESTSLDLNDNFSNNVEFSVYPNPTNGALNVKLLQLNNLSSLMLFDLLGKTLINKVIDPNGNQLIKLDLSSYPKGVYILTIIQNGRPFSKKVVLY
ncbi:MAG TPA: T9SS type A sorting domain-containing protein [Flavobacteriaceae bacterium]|nr:T9SS type A sorting domain-containing protein [Flavobacteriaceae bacterium]